MVFVHAGFIMAERVLVLDHAPLEHPMMYASRAAVRMPCRPILQPCLVWEEECPQAGRHLKETSSLR